MPFAISFGIASHPAGLNFTIVDAILFYGAAISSFEAEEPRCEGHIQYLMFASQDDFEVCGEAENGQEALEMAQILRPDLIMLDLSMPVMSGIEAACALKRLMPMTPIIVFSEYSDVFSESEARETGVAALVSKTESISVLVEKARAVTHPTAA